MPKKEKIIIKKYAPYSSVRFKKIVQSLEVVEWSLDLGCSIGVLTKEIAEKSKKVVAFDINKRAVKVAKEISPKNCFCVIGDATALPFKNNSFNQIVSSEVVEHIMDYKKYIQEAFRVSKKGGNFMLTTPNRSVNFPSIGYIPAPSISWFLGKLTRNPLFLYPYGHYFGGFSAGKLRNSIQSVGFKAEQTDYRGFLLGKIIDDILYIISIKKKIYGDVLWANEPNEKYLKFYLKFVPIIEHCIKLDSFFVQKLGLQGYVLFMKCRK